MGLSGSMLRQGSRRKPDVYSALKGLVGWTREDLREAVEIFQASASAGSTVGYWDFAKIMAFDDDDVAETAFEQFRPKDGGIDFYHVIAPMVVMSDMNFVSRASFLFSLFDFRGAGYISYTEFFIGVLALFQGLASYVKSQPRASSEEIERMARPVFAKLDSDGDGIVLLGEFLTYAYRSEEWSDLTCHFSSSETAVFEDPLNFLSLRVENTESSFQSHSLSSSRTLKQAGKRLRNRIKIVPDPLDEPHRKPAGKPVAQPRRRPWREPAAFSRGHAWCTWCFFKHMARGGRAADIEELIRAVSDDLVCGAVLEEATSGAEERGIRPDSARTGMQLVCFQLSGGHVRDRLLVLKDTGTTLVSLRAFCCMVWPLVKESEMEALLRWVKAYHTSFVLSQVIKSFREEEPDLDVEDIDALLGIVEDNADGALTADELSKFGHINLQLARQQVSTTEMQLLPPLTKAEIKAIIYHLDLALKEQFKPSIGEHVSSPASMRATRSLASRALF